MWTSSNELWTRMSALLSSSIALRSTIAQIVCHFYFDANSSFTALWIFRTASNALLIPNAWNLAHLFGILVLWHRIFGTLTWSLIIVQITHRFLSQNYIGTVITKLPQRYVPVFLHNIHSAEPVWCNGRAFDAGARRPGFETRTGQLHLPIGKEINQQSEVAQFAKKAHWVELSPQFVPRARPTPLNCKKAVPCVCTREGNCSTGSSWLYHLGVSQAQKPRNREMSARGYVLHSVCP